MRRAHWLAAVLAFALLGVVGCGGGGGDETTSTPTVATTPSATTLSKEELIAQGDAICAEVNAAVGTVGSTSTDSAGRLAQEAALYGGMVERLKGLGTPEESTGYPEFIAAAEELSQAESDVKLAADRGDAAGLEAAESEVSSALASFQSAAQSYGFEDCAAGPSAPPTSATAPSTEEASEGEEEAAPEAEPEAEAEPAPETGGAGNPEAGGGAATGGGTTGGATEGSGGSSSGGIGPG